MTSVGGPPLRLSSADDQDRLFSGDFFETRQRGRCCLEIFLFVDEMNGFFDSAFHLCGSGDRSRETDKAAIERQPSTNSLCVSRFFDSSSGDDAVLATWPWIREMVPIDSALLARWFATALRSVCPFTGRAHLSLSFRQVSFEAFSRCRRFQYDRV